MTKTVQVPRVLSNSDDSERSHSVIPGGAHTYSKGDDQFPANAPAHLERGDGVQVWARDGREFLDWTMGLRSVSLGYGIKSVNDAAIDQIAKGSNFGRPSFIETEYAPPYALQLAVWLPLALVLSLALLQPVKGAIVGLQWALRMHGFGELPDADALPGKEH